MSLTNLWPGSWVEEQGKGFILGDMPLLDKLAHRVTCGDALFKIQDPQLKMQCNLWNNRQTRQERRLVRYTGSSTENAMQLMEQSPN